MNNQLLIRADANSEIGFGHAMRCLALAQAAHSNGDRVHFAFSNCPQEILDAYSSIEAALVALPSPAFGMDEAELISKYSLTHGIPWNVVDSYQHGEGYIIKLRESGINVLCFDDTGIPQNKKANIIVNQNVSAKSEWYAGVSEGSTLLLGARYTMLRKEFLTFSQSPKSNTILVTTGGSDDLNCSKSIIEVLLPLLPEGYTCTCIIGSASLCSHELHEAFAHNPKVRLVENVSNMQPHISSANLVITGAGSTVWECLYLGVPIVTMILAENQAAIARHLGKYNLACNAGDAQQPNFLEKLASIVRSYFIGTENFDANAERGKELIDGRGPNRILASLQT